MKLKKIIYRIKKAFGLVKKRPIYHLSLTLSPKVLAEISKERR